MSVCCGCQRSVGSRLRALARSSALGWVYARTVSALSSRTRPQPQGRASSQVRTLDLSVGLRRDQSLKVSLTHR
jgi:hypothetical protein